MSAFGVKADIRSATQKLQICRSLMLDRFIHVTIVSIDRDDSIPS